MKKILLFALNLQLFADLNTNTTGDAGLSAENKTYYDMRLIDEATPNLVHSQFAQKRPIPKGKGKKIEFRKYASLPKALTPLSEGVTPDGRKLSVTTIEAEVNQYGDYVAYSDVLDLTAIDDNVVEATQLLGNQAGLTMDTIHRNVLLTGTNVMYCPKGTTTVTAREDLDATAKLTVDMVKKVVAWLKKNNAPKIDGSYMAIIHPYVAYDLMSDPAWIDAHKYAQPENIYEGEIGKIGGVRFVETSEAKSFGGGKYATLFMGANAYGVTEIDGGGLRTIIKQLGSGGTSDPLDQRATVGWKAMTTAEILVQQYLVRVESGSGYPTAAEEN